jgi:UDP-N-acetylmuramate dehydrogenase
MVLDPVLDAAQAAVVLERIRSRVGPQVSVPQVSVPQYPDGSGRIKLSAAWLIERAGFTRGYRGPGGRVALSGKHTLALTNRGGAGTEDLLALAREIRDGVAGFFGVTLVPEPVLVNCAL